MEKTKLQNKIRLNAAERCQVQNAYKDIGRAKSAILQNPVNAGKESETTPRNEENQAGAAVVIRKKFRRCLEDQGHHEQSSAYGDVDCSDFLLWEFSRRTSTLIKQ